MDESTFVKLFDKAENSPELIEYMNSIDVKPIIEDLAEGRKYYSYKELGVNLVFQDLKLKSVQFFSKSIAFDEGIVAYAGKLPCNLTFFESRESVKKKLGEPAKYREGLIDSRPFVSRNPWVKYFLNGYSLHVEFEMDTASIRLVTLSGE